MIIELNEPFALMSGVVSGINPENVNERYYFCHNRRTGRMYLKRCPTRKRKPTPAQLAARARFIELYGKGRRIKRNDPKTDV